MNIKITEVLNAIAVARNPNTPPEALVQLASDEDWVVRYWVSCNPKTPIETLEQLASDEEWDVRWGVAWNSNTPNYIKRLAIYSTILDQN